MAKREWELEDLIALMKDNKVLKVQMGGLTVELSPLAYVKQSEMNEASKPEAMPSEDELLRWSVPGAFLEQEEVLKPNV